MCLPKLLMSYAASCFPANNPDRKPPPSAPATSRPEGVTSAPLEAKVDPATATGTEVEAEAAALAAPIGPGPFCPKK